MEKDVETGPIRQVDGQVIFRVPEGTLYSLPATLVAVSPLTAT